MNLIRYQSYQPSPLHQQLAREFSRAAERSTNADASPSAIADWTPAVDITETADKFVLLADIPGVDPTKVEVTLEKGVLTLSGSREQPAEVPGVEAKRQERASGRFFRRFALPDTVDGEAVSASNRHGVLEVVIPKRPAALARRIAVVH